jgi:hypothetical protein
LSAAVWAIDHRIAPGLDVMAGHPVQPAGEPGIREIQMFGDAQEMQIGSVVDDGRGYGDADGAAQIAHEREKTAG